MWSWIVFPYPHYRRLAFPVSLNLSVVTMAVLLILIPTF